MMLPRETLAEEWDETAMPAYPATRYGSVHAGGVEPARATAIAEALMAAENPVAFAAYLGRKPEAVTALDRLARACGIRVADSIRSTSTSPRIRRASPFRSAAFAGARRSRPAARFRRAVRAAICQRANAIKWIQIDIDALKADFPMWGFATDMRIQGDCATVLNQVLEAVEARADDAYRKRVAERIASWSGAREVFDHDCATAVPTRGRQVHLIPLTYSQHSVQAFA